MKYDDNLIKSITSDNNFDINLINNNKGIIYNIKQKIGFYLFPLFYYSFIFQFERKYIDLLCIIIETIQLLSFPLNYRVSKFYI